MITTISITNKWQLHVPVEARKIMGMKKPGMVTVKVKSGQLIIAPKKSKILTMGGKLNKYFKRKPIDLENVRNIIDYSS